MSTKFEMQIALYLSNDLEAATVLEMMRDWIAHNTKHNRNYKEGYFWTYNTLKEWHAQASFCSPKKLYNRICKLRDKGLIITKKFNKIKGDQTLWYRVNEEKYQQIINGTYINDDDDIQKPPKRNKKKETTKDALNSKGKMAHDFPTEGNSINNELNSNIKKKEIKRRGWYLPPDHEDYNTWKVSGHLQSKISKEYGLTFEQIEDAYTEFVLYNNAMGIKIQSIVAMFTLWCKRFAKKLKTYVKKTYKKTSKVVETKIGNCKEAILNLINLNKDNVATKINTALLEHFGPHKYKNMGLMELKPVYDSTTTTLDFVSIGLYLPDGIYRLRTLKSELLTIVRKIYYEVTKIKICGT